MKSEGPTLLYNGPSILGFYLIKWWPINLYQGGSFYHLMSASILSYHMREVPFDAKSMLSLMVRYDILYYSVTNVVNVLKILFYQNYYGIFII